jgi:arylformamidase
MAIDPANEALYNNQQLVPEAPEIMAALDQDSQAFRENARADFDIAYGAGEREKLDLFLPENDDWAALMVFIHGGYWQMRSRENFSALAEGLLGCGLPVAMPSYDLCPQVTVGDITNQVRRACVHLWNAHKKPLVITGHSAGGHLSACMLGTDWAAEGAGDLEIKGAAPISGVFDLMPLVNTSINQALGLDANTAKLYSPLMWTPRVKAPMKVFVGGGESQGFLDQSSWMVDTWGPYGVPSELIEVPQANHFTVLAPLRDKSSAMVQTIAGLAG